MIRRYLFLLKIFVGALSGYFAFSIFYYFCAEQEPENTAALGETNDANLLALKDLIPIDYELEKVQFLMEDDFDEPAKFAQEEQVEAYTKEVLKSTPASLKPNESKAEIRVVDVQKMESQRMENASQQKVETQIQSEQSNENMQGQKK